MIIQHPTLKAELLYLVGRASMPLSSAELFDRSELADDVIKVSKALNNLMSDGKIERVPGDGRARYRLAGGVAAPAPAGKAGRSKAVQKDDASSAPAEMTEIDMAVPGDRHGLVKLPNKPLQAPRDGDDHFVDANKMVDQAERKATSPSPSDVSLADAILARLKRDLGPLLRPPVVGDVDVSTAPGVITIHVERVEISIHVGVSAPVPSQEGRRV